MMSSAVTPKPELFVWHSNYLKNYRPGTIAVVAFTADEARAKILAAFEDDLRERRPFLFEFQDDDDRAAIADYRQLLVADLVADPKVVSLLFVGGSE